MGPGHRAATHHLSLEPCVAGVHSLLEGLIIPSFCRLKNSSHASQSFFRARRQGWDQTGCPLLGFLHNVPWSGAEVKKIGLIIRRYSVNRGKRTIRAYQGQVVSPLGELEMEEVNHGSAQRC